MTSGRQNRASIKNCLYKLLTTFNFKTEFFINIMTILNYTLIFIVLIENYENIVLNIICA